MIIPRRKPHFPDNIIFETFRFILNGNNENEIKKLEQDLENKIGIKNAVVVSSGRLGLYLILKHSGLKIGSEIIIPGFTFGLLKNFIKKAGFKPVPVDIDPNTFQMDVISIKKALTKNTSAILATHIFGEPCNIQKIAKVAKTNKLLLIEDCAESMGAKSQNKVTGSFGDISLSSFNIAKPLQGITGGVVFGKNTKIIKAIRKEIENETGAVDATKKEVIRSLVGYFVSQTFFWPILMYIFSFDKFRNLFVSTYRAGDNTKVVSFKLPQYLAHITRLNLISFKSRLTKRQTIRGWYVKHLSGYLDFQKPYPKTKGSNYMIVAKIMSDPLMLRRKLAISGIDIAIKDEIADNCLDDKNSFASLISNHTISLPLYEELTVQEVKYVSNAIKKLVPIATTRRA